MPGRSASFQRVEFVREADSVLLVGSSETRAHRIHHGSGICQGDIENASVLRRQGFQGESGGSQTRKRVCDCIPDKAG